MKTAVGIALGALAVYLVWKYAPGGDATAAPCGCHDSNAPIDSASMNVDAAAATNFGPAKTTGLLPSTTIAVSVRPIPRAFSDTLRSVIAGEDAPQPALPTPTSETFASASGQPGTNGTLARQVNPPAPLAARLRLLS